MNQRLQQGFSLIELIVFIVVIGIVASGLLLGMKQVLVSAAVPSRIIEASFLAQARMEVVLMKRGISGYATLSDPCATAGLAICTVLASYASNNRFTVAAITISGTNPKVITVTVSDSTSNQAIRTISTRVYDYAKN